MLFRMVPKLLNIRRLLKQCFRAVLFRMVPKQLDSTLLQLEGFRAVLFRMVSKPTIYVSTV